MERLSEETNAPYGVAKKALITMAQAYRQQYGLNAICMLPVNLYGPGDNFDLKSSHVIPAMIRKCVDATDAGLHDIVLWATAHRPESFYTSMIVHRGLVLAAERYDGVEPVNLGAGFEIRMRDLADMIVRLTGFQGSVRWDTSRPNGQPRRMLDTTRAKEQFGFSPQTSFEQGLTQTITWYQQNKERIRQHEPAISS
jgi:GDP-L-fucose synthase